MNLLIILKAVCDYLIYFENNPRKALEIAAEAQIVGAKNDWWWKARLGKCYFKVN
jgi:tetratricopeptide repeat protein 8